MNITATRQSQPMTLVTDLNERITHEINVGQVYGDSRSKDGEDDDYGEKLRLVYKDDERVVLRSNKELTHGRHRGHPHYRCELRDTFEDYAASGRYTLIEDVEDAPREPTDGVATALTVLKRLRAAERRAYDAEGGRKQKHRHEAFSEAVEAVSNIDPMVIDWTTVEGVGAATAENLKEAGYQTDVDVQGASDEDLLDIGGVGQKNLQNIKDRAGAA